MKRTHDMGCEIHNHSYTHSNMTQLSCDMIREEIALTNEKIYEVISEYPKFFRPPYIAVNDNMYESISLPFIAGYGANDWEDTKAQERSQRILDQVNEGSIILLHDMEGNIETVKALDLLIPELLKRDYEFVTISELFY